MAVQVDVLDCDASSPSCRAGLVLMNKEGSDRKRMNFPGPLMNGKLQKDKLMSFIQGQQKKCLHDLTIPDKQKEYFFWLIMELFCNKNGRVKMSDIAKLLFRGYGFIRRKVGCVMSKEDWCLPLATLLCSSAPDTELRNQIIEMGDEFVSRNWLYAAQICYVAAQIELESRNDFLVIGCFSEPENELLAKEAIERTEVYEYVLSLTTGFGQLPFQIYKMAYCYLTSEEGFTDHLLDYCQTITAEVLRFPQRKNVKLIRDLKELIQHCSLFLMTPEEVKCLSDLQLLFNEEKKFNPSDHIEFDSSYSLEEKLGEGGFGSVYAGVRKSDGKAVAIKCVAKSFQDEHITIPGQTHKLPLEVALMKMVSKAPRCEQVLQMLEWFETCDFVIMVLEQPKPCMDLSEFMRSKNYKLSEPIIQKIMVQVLEAAQHCCDRGVLHRDIKPDNILINPNTLKIKLIDFGCGHLLKDTFYDEYAGTQGYYPPEWVNYQRYYGIPATIWSLGILLFELTCGDCPFMTDKEIVNGSLTFTSDFSIECIDLIRRCLKQDPRQRPTIKEILNSDWIKQGQ